MTLNIKFEKRKALKISEEIIPIAGDPKRWWNFCVSKDNKKEIDPMFIEDVNV